MSQPAPPDAAPTPPAAQPPRPRRRRHLLGDDSYLSFIDRTEQQLAKVLGLLLVLVMVVATVQLIWQVGTALTVPTTEWVGSKLTKVLGDLLNLLIGLEVLQNITSYLRRHVVQIELVLITALTAVARKVIVLPPGAESKPQLLAGLGLAALCLAGAFWLVRSLTMQKPPTRTGPAIRIRDGHP